MDIKCKLESTDSQALSSGETRYNKIFTFTDESKREHKILINLSLEVIDKYGLCVDSDHDNSEYFLESFVEKNKNKILENISKYYDRQGKIFTIDGVGILRIGLIDKAVNNRFYYNKYTTLTLIDVKQDLFDNEHSSD